MDILIASLICAAGGLLTGFFIGREFGRKNLIPFMEENDHLKKLVQAPPEQPQYTDYTGEQGTFLGRFRSSLGEGGEGYNYDLYLDERDPKVVIARYGNGNGDFVMVPPDEKTTVEALYEGVRRAKEAGLC